MELIYKDESYALLGSFFEVYKEMGCGFLEAVYQECLMLELRSRNIPFVAQPQLQVAYKGQSLAQYYVPDFICYEKIVLELKAVAAFADEYRAQLHNYLKATGHKLGFLVNFGHYPKLEYERIVR